MLMACNDTTWQPAPSSPDSKPTGDESDPTCSLPAATDRFDGVTVNFYANNHSSAARSIDLGDGDDPDHIVNAAVKKRNEQVEKELGVDIILTATGDMQGTYSQLQPILASEIYVYDVVMLNQYFDMGLAVGDTVGSFYNLCDLPEGVKNYLNLEASYWDQSIFEGLTYKGINFFLTGDLTLTHDGSMYVSFVNADMWARYADDIAKLEHSGGYDDVYDIVKNGYWTLDLWMELAKLCYEDNGDGVKGYEDQAGFMTYDQQLNNIMVDALMAGSNMRFAGKETDGTPTIEVNTDQNVEIYTKLYTLLCESDTVTIPWLGGSDKEEGSYILDIFAKGTVLLNVSTLARAETYLLDMEDNFYICPLPLFDHGQFDSSKASLGYTTRHNSMELSQLAICTAIGDEKLPAVTATLELMGYYSEKWVTPAYYEAIFGADYGHDPRVPEMLDLIEEGLYTDFVFAWSHSLGDITWQFRQHYSEGAKIEKNLRDWDRNATGLLNNKVLQAIEERFILVKG